MAHFFKKKPIFIFIERICLDSVQGKRIDCVIDPFLLSRLYKYPPLQPSAISHATPCECLIKLNAGFFQTGVGGLNSCTELRLGAQGT